MKKVFSLMLLLATILTFTACGDDDKEEPTPPVNYADKLVGTWVYEESTTNDKLGVTVSIESIWTFQKANRTCSWTVQSKVNDRVTNSTGISGIYSYDGKTLKITHDGTMEELQATVSGSSFTITTESGNSMTHYKR